ncbi:MAG TPA: serine hydrolase domain-containing protein [Acidimicrobiales bacterium]|nr:serine hydrolase domain-containing protein [Acidimicrobiales bacterium]
MGTVEVNVDPRAFGVDPGQLARVEAHFNAYVENRRLPGWLATVARGGEIVWKGSGGLRDREARLPVTDDTIWRVASMTKPVTSIAAMMLYEEGHFDLNDDVGRWIDSFQSPRVYVGGTPAKPLTVPAIEPVRVHHLLTHMSGLTYGFQYTHPVDAMYRAKGYDFGYPGGTDLAGAVDDWIELPLLFQPGSAWNYSVSVDVLGRLVELWSGQRLDEFIKERITDPLAMTDTHWWCPPEKADRLASAYVPSRDGAKLLEAATSNALREPRLLSGGGGLFSTAHDYHRFATMLLRGGELDGVRLLSSRTLELMTRNHLPHNQDLASTATGQFAEADYAGVGFGLGFSVAIDQARNKSLVSAGTFGWGGAFSTVFWVDPAEDLTVSFFTQLLPSSTYKIRRELQRLVYPALVD